MSSEVGVEPLGHVVLVEMRRPPHNHVDIHLVHELADVLERLAADDDCRAIVLAAQRRSFCAGGNFATDGGEAFSQGRIPTVYEAALRLFRASKPMVAAIHGAAVGGGLGLALVADFRVTCPEARFSANFARLGVNPGFGLTVTLPELIGRNRAELLFLTGRRLDGDEAVRIGLANVLVERESVRDAAIALATEIGECAPLAVASTRTMMREDLIRRIEAAAPRVMAEQRRLRETEDFREGVRAASERRTPRFLGR